MTFEAFGIVRSQQHPLEISGLHIPDTNDPDSAIDVATLTRWGNPELEEPDEACAGLSTGSRGCEHAPTTTSHKADVLARTWLRRRKEERDLSLD